MVSSRHPARHSNLGLRDSSTQHMATHGNIQYTVLYISRLGVWLAIYRAFHNPLGDYKNLLQENRRKRIYETCTDRRNNSNIY